jgi:Protein of unknown function (DUF4058)
MPIRDHFHSPVNDKHRWEAVHGGWPMEIVRTLFNFLPDGFIAEPKVYHPTPFEVTTDLADLDEYEVRIYDAERQRSLVAAIEIVSPANKDRPESREQFNAKVAALLRQDVCVAIVDIVTIRQANLYAELIAKLGHTDPKLGDPPAMVYAVTLRGRKPPKKRALLDAWFFPLALGRPLPTIPLWLASDLAIELPLEASYQEVCRLLRIA